MNFHKLAKQATAVTLSTAILLGGSGTLTFAKEKDSSDYKNTYGISHITRSDMEKMVDQQSDPRYTVPTFDKTTIKNIPSAKKNR